MREIEEENRIRKSIDEKPLEPNDEMWEENRKMISLMKKPSNLD